MNTGERKERRGFASMSPEKQREIASKGGRAAHEKGTAHEWTRRRSAQRRPQGRSGESRRTWAPDRPPTRCRRPPAQRRRQDVAAGESCGVTRSIDATTTLEATNNGKTRSRGLGAGARRGGERAALRPGLQGHPRGRVQPPPRHSPRRPPRRRKRDRRRRRSSATLGCGLCRPPKCSRTVSGR